MRVITSNNRVRFSCSLICSHTGRDGSGNISIVFSVFFALTICSEEARIYFFLMCCEGGENLPLFSFGNTVVVEGFG